MAQSRKPSARHTEDWVTDNCLYNDSWSDGELACQRNKPILEVGGPRLFEKPQSGVSKMPRSLDPTDRTRGDDDSAYCTDDARCLPNGLRRKKSCSQQEQPRASGTRTKQGHTEGVGSARRAGNDWEGIRGLGNDLLFEILRLVLVFSLTFARVGSALGEEIGDDICQWLEKRSLENRHKKGWVAIEDSKERNSEGGQNTQLQNTHPCTEPYTLADICSYTEAHSQVHLLSEDPCPQDHHHPYSDYQDEELQHPESTRNPPEIMASTGATPGSSASSLDSVQPVTTMFYMPMPPPGTPGSPMFEGANVTEFLERYEDLCLDYHVSAGDRLARLPRYCIQPIAETIKSLKEWEDQDYAALKKVLLAEYKDNDTHQLLYSVPFLENYKSIPRTGKDDILDYCRKFNRIAQHCIKKGVLTKFNAGVWFIHVLPLSTSSKLIRKFSIDTEDPTTVDYQAHLEHVMKQTASDKAIQRMNATQAPSRQQSEVVDQIVGQLCPTVSVTKKQRLAEPVVKPTQTSNTTDTAVDNLTKAFEKLSVNLVQQIQSQQPYQRPGGSYGQYPRQLYRNPPADTSRAAGPGVGSGPPNASGKLPLASIGAYGLSQGSGRT